MIAKGLTEATEFLSKIGFPKDLLKKVSKNEKVASRLCTLLESHKIQSLDQKSSPLIYYIASSGSEVLAKHEDFLLTQIVQNRLESKQQLRLAEEYLDDKAQVEDLKAFDEACWVGKSITDEDIKSFIEKFVKEKEELLLSCGGKINHPTVMNEIKQQLPIADPGSIIKIGSGIVKEQLGDKVKEIQQKEKNSKKKKKKDKNAEVEQFTKIDLSKLVARDVAGGMNTPELIEAQRKATGGKIITRFPPEPNGILHIGHSRAIRFNFSIAGAYEGDCNLRFDDTNPAKEEIEFINKIKENVAWMGYSPARVLHASDWFPKIYE